MDEVHRDEAYRIYVARSLQLIPQNQYLAKTYFEFLESDTTPADDRDSREIVIDTMLRAGLRFED